MTLPFYVWRACHTAPSKLFQGKERPTPTPLQKHQKYSVGKHKKTFTYITIYTKTNVLIVKHKIYFVHPITPFLDVDKKPLLYQIPGYHDSYSTKIDG